jgi:hypothetical protein
VNTPRALLLIAVTLAAGCDTPKDAPAKGSATPSSTQAAPVTRGSAGANSSAQATTTSVATPASATPAAKAPERPLYYDRAITPADLEGRTLREFALLRNTIYARAGNKFRRPWLNAYFGGQPWYKPLDVMDESKITETDRKNARLIAETDAAIAKEDLERRRDVVLARKKAGKEAPEDAVELSLLSQRLGVWLGGDEKPDEARSPLEDPAQLTRLLRVEELSTLSRRDLRILRNTIYARHGRIFQSAVVRDYFKGAEWYRPDPMYDDGRLSEIDAKNIRLIKSIEDSLGGPLHENPNYGDVGWFVQA